MGIGGLDREFSDIFRRAFASRVFPPDIVEQMGECSLFQSTLPSLIHLFVSPCNSDDDKFIFLLFNIISLLFFWLIKVASSPEISQKCIMHESGAKHAYKTLF